MSSSAGSTTPHPSSTTQDPTLSEMLQSLRLHGPEDELVSHQIASFQAGLDQASPEFNDVGSAFVRIINSIEVVYAAVSSGNTDTGPCFSVQLTYAQQMQMLTLLGLQLIC